VGRLGCVFMAYYRTLEAQFAVEKSATQNYAARELFVAMPINPYIFIFRLGNKDLLSSR